MTSSALAIAPTHDEAPAPRRWSLARRIAFRFVVVYAAAFAFQYSLDMFPKSEDYTIKLWEAVSAFDAWIARHLLGLAVAPDAVAYNGSGDRLVDWVHLLVMLALAAIVCVIWSVIDRRRPHYAGLARGVRVAARYYLAYVMANFGLLKLVGVQFAFPSSADLVAPFGDKSPMGLLWAFMGYSSPYSWFTGAAEILGAVLLLSRRTTTLGAVVLIGVMSNVVMLNFCYDVPVKILSTHLLAAAVYLAARDLRRLASVFVFNRTAEPADLGPARSRRELGVKIAMIALGAAAQLQIGWDLYHRYGAGKPQPTFAGAWEVTAMRRNGLELPPLGSDDHRWRGLVVTSWATMVQGVDDEHSTWHRMSYDASTATMTLERRQQVQPWVLHATRDGDELRLDGFYDHAAVEITLKKRAFLLETRGFHWVNDFPYNR